MGLPGRPAEAFSIGRTGSSGKQGSTCNLCHRGGTAPVVRFEGPGQVAAGTLATFRFVVQSQAPTQTAAGFNVAASGGRLAIVAGQGEHALGGEITHSAPKVDSDGVASFEFTWQAPTQPATYKLFGAGISANHNGSSSGDLSAATTHDVVVPGEAATPTATPTPREPTPPGPTPTPSPTATPVLNLCVGDCDGNGEVAVNELVTGVNIALGSLPLSSCGAFDSNGDEDVAVNELLQGVNAALNGCPLLGS